MDTRLIISSCCIGLVLMGSCRKSEPIRPNSPTIIPSSPIVPPSPEPKEPKSPDNTKKPETPHFAKFIYDDPKVPALAGSSYYATLINSTELQDECNFIMGNTYPKWIEPYLGRLRLGSMVLGDELGKATVVHDKKPINMFILFNQGPFFTDIGKIDITNEDAMQKVYDQVPTLFNGEIGIGSNYRRYYRDMRELHTMFWGIYPDVEKELFGRSYSDKTNPNRFKGGTVFHREIEIGSLRFEMEDTDINDNIYGLQKTRKIVDIVRFGWFYILVVDIPELRDYEKIPKDYQGTIAYLNLLSGRKSYGRQAIADYEEAYKKEKIQQLYMLTNSPRGIGGHLGFKVKLTLHHE